MTETFDSVRAAEVGGRRIWLAVLAGVVLFLVYVGLSFLNDPDGTLSTDVGGKTATLRVMEAGRTSNPDLGYWAGEWDPSAEYHGLYYTAVVDGKYVNVTTLPVLELARPLFDWGGYRAALVWSMAGAVAAAFAARGLAARTGADARRAWLAFWLVGLASPVLLYALDLWEHAPGLALMAWGVVAMVDVAAGRAIWPAVLAGAAFGAAFTVRTEAVAYGFVVVAVGCLLLWRRRSAAYALIGGSLAGIGFVGMAAANYLLEVTVLGASLRAERASGTAAVGGVGVGIRVKEAFTTAVGLFPSTEPGRLAIGVLAAGLLGWAIWRTSRPGGQGPARMIAVGIVLLYLIRAVDGLGFIPGLVTTAPFALAGVVLAWDERVRRPARDAALMALVALPVVWVFQYSGGAVPQWGGRYVLTSGLVLAAVGIGASGLLERWMQFFLVGMSVAIAVFGLAWMSHRTHEIGRAARTVAAIDTPLVSAQDFWLRELGAVYGADSRWLSVTGVREVPDATRILEEAGEPQFVLLWIPGERGAGAPDLAGWTPTDERTESWLGAEFRLTTYTRD